MTQDLKSLSLQQADRMMGLNSKYQSQGHFLKSPYFHSIGNQSFPQTDWTHDRLENYEAEWPSHNQKDPIAIVNQK